MSILADSMRFTTEESKYLATSLYKANIFVTRADWDLNMSTMWMGYQYAREIWNPDIHPMPDKHKAWLIHMTQNVKFALMNEKTKLNGIVRIPAHRWDAGERIACGSLNRPVPGSKDEPDRLDLIDLLVAEPVKSLFDDSDIDADRLIRALEYLIEHGLGKRKMRDKPRWIGVVKQLITALEEQRAPIFTHKNRNLLKQTLNPFLANILRYGKGEILLIELYSEII